MKKTALLLSLILLLSFSLRAGESLAQQFQKPPEETKPWCYWYWYKSDITLDGITKDLEAMKKAGIRLAMIGNIDYGGHPPGPVKMFTPEWKAATKHAMSEGARLGIEIYMFNSPGWSQSGGPWIKPEQSMRRVIWNEVPAKGGPFSAKVRNAPQDIAVLAVPRKKSVSVPGVIPPGKKDAVSFSKSWWIWHPAEDGATNASAGTKYFKKVFQADPDSIEAAKLLIAADNSFVAWVNGKEVAKGADWKMPQEISITPHLKSGENVLAVAVTNPEASPSGLVAALMMDAKDGKQDLIPTDASWLVGSTGVEEWRENGATPEGWQPARVLGAVSMNPWRLSGEAKSLGKIVRFEHSEPFMARGLMLVPKAPNWAVNQRMSNAVMVEGKLYAVDEKGARTLVSEIKAVGSNPFTDFLPLEPVTYSFKDTTAKVFEFEGTPTAGVAELTLGSEPLVAKVVEKQLGRMHATPSPTWDSYIFPETEQPADSSAVVRRSEILNLTDKLDANGVLNCELPPGDWTILYFGMVTTGKRNYPAPPEGSGLECDKMSKEHIRFNFQSMFDGLFAEMTPEERKGFKGVTIDSYEVGSQNWTDGFDKTFAGRIGFDPIPMLPVLTGRVVESAKDSDGFLLDLRRTVSELVVENYVGGLREVAAEHGLRLWCENYGHWGFPSEFLSYGGYADQIGGEFWSGGLNLGSIESRAASSAAHIYGKQTVFAEAFTSFNDFSKHPYVIKRRGEELFCEVERHNLGSMAYYYMGTGSDENEDVMTSVILGNSLLTGRGVPVAGEYEVKNAQAMKIMDTFGIGGSFTEYYAADFREDVVLLGHDGPGHIKIASSKTKVRPLDVYHGKVGRGLSVEMSVQHGPVTLLSVIEGANGRPDFLVAEGESVPGPILQIGNTNSRYKFPIGARGFMEQWNAHGPAHHCAIGVGHIAGKLKKLAALLGIEMQTVC